MPICLAVQVSFTGTNSKDEIVNNSFIQTVYTNSTINSSFTWSNLIHGEYQFSVVAFTSKGPGEAANLMLFSNGKLILYPLMHMVLIRIYVHIN